MNYDRDRAMREQEATEAMIRMRDPAHAARRTVSKHLRPEPECRCDTFNQILCPNHE